MRVYKRVLERDLEEKGEVIIDLQECKYTFKKLILRKLIDKETQKEFYLMLAREKAPIGQPYEYPLLTTEDFNELLERTRRIKKLYD